MPKGKWQNGKDICCTLNKGLICLIDKEFLQKIYIEREHPSANLGRGKEQAIPIRIQVANKPMNR